MNTVSDESQQVLTIADLKDVISLEIVQHSKIQVILEKINARQAITAQLQNVDFTESGPPCIKLSHNVLHSDSQSFITISVHAEDQNQGLGYIPEVLAWVLFTCFLVWLLRKWMAMIVHRDEVSKDETKDQTVQSREFYMQDLPKNVLSSFTSSAVAMTLNKRGDQSACKARIGYFTSIILAAIICVVLVKYGFRITSEKDCSILKLRIPEDKHIRHMRSYSEDPSIKDIQLIKDSSSALITRLQLLDLSPQCQGNLKECRTHALCDNFVSAVDVRCRCNSGFYLLNLTCMPCTTSCEDGFYMTRQCGAAGDVICAPCSQCEGSRYAVAGCTSTQDTICIDVTFPINQFLSRMKSIDDFVSLNVSMSKNVFLERLQGIKKLETPLYISSNQQELQFIERRPSGLEINVKVSDIYLIPEYFDVDHTDDWEFIAKHTQYPQVTKDKLLRIKDNYCRSPLPDEYDLQLEVSKNISLAAMEITCDANNRNLPACPKGYSDGDKYVYQRLTTPCPKVNTNGTIFEDRSNNILCLGNSDLLSAIFAQRVEDPTLLTFPSEECKKTEENCSRCIAKTNCMFGSIETNCCNQSCYASKACKSYYAGQCSQSHVECIRGDVTKFSIAPRYPEIQRKFACHMQHQPPEYLYKVTYVASIPRMQFTFEQRSKAVTFRNRRDQQYGMDNVDYLTMNHVTDNKYDDEVILVGNLMDRDPFLVQQFELHKMRDSRAFKRFRHNNTYKSISKLNQRTGIQFEKPFLYTTRSWSEGSCDKNVSMILPAQKMYDSKVNVKMPEKKKKNGRFVYQLVSETSQPHIRFFISENSSILSHYKATYKSATFHPGSLKGNMTWNKDTMSWNVTVSGSISSCPGLYTMGIYTEDQNLQLAIYDMFINCPQNTENSHHPQNFSVGFNIQRKSVQVIDVFTIILNDTVSSYRLLLSSVQGPQFFNADSSERSFMKTKGQLPWIPIFVIIFICMCISILLVVTYVYCDKQKSSFIPSYITITKPDLGPQITLLESSIDKVKDTKLSTRTKLIIAGLMVLYTAYAILFTFSAVFALFFIIQGPSLSQMTLVSNGSLQVRVQMECALHKIIHYENEESDRMVEALKDRFKACSHHFKTNLFESIPNVNLRLQKFLNTLFKNNGIVQEKLEKYLFGHYAGYQNEIEKFVSKFRETLNQNLHKLQAAYTSYLNSIVQNNWLIFPKEIFMTQHVLQGRPLSNITDDLMGFLSWLEVDKVQEIIEIKEILMNRITNMIPKLEFARFLHETDVQENLSSTLSDFNFTENNFRFSYNRRTGFPHLKQHLEPDMSESEQFGFNVEWVLFPVVISVFIVFDCFLLWYRFSWLIENKQTFKNGWEEKIPYDFITRKAYFILTGYLVPCTEDSHNFQHELFGKRSSLCENSLQNYLRYMHADPTTKEEMLKEMAEKLKASTKKNKSIVDIVKKNLIYAYRLFIAPVFWRFLLVLVFVLLLCMVAMATNDLVTVESAMFLLDTEAMVPLLERQSDITNAAISHYVVYLNSFQDIYQQVFEGQIQILNTLMMQLAETQNNLLNDMISDLCNLATGTDSCKHSIDLVALSLTSCNFLPIQMKSFSGFQESILQQRIQSELTPLVLYIRSIIFSSLNLLLTYAGILIICQIIACVIFVYLKNSEHLKITKIYQLSSMLGAINDPNSYPKDEIYASQSLIAESWESGVYID